MSGSETTAALPGWITQLPLTIGTALAGNLIYDALKSFVEHAHFSDAMAAKAEGMMFRVHVIPQVGIEECAEFLRNAWQDDGFARDLQKSFNKSADALGVEEDTI